MLQRCRARLRALWHWNRQASEIDQEIQFHLSEEANERVRGPVAGTARLLRRHRSRPVSWRGRSRGRHVDGSIVNAYQFGFIGASDNHTAAAPLDEDNYFGKVGILDSRGDLRGSVPLAPDVAELVAAAGRLRVEEIDGEQYETGGYDFEAPMLTQTDMLSQAYASDVSMGGELLAQHGGVPTLIVWATRDPASAPLQRLRTIKGWTVDGEHHEQVYDVACSDGGTVDPRTHRCPDNGVSVDLSDCSITTGVGAGEPKTVWRDPDFNPEHRACYYARGLENPTCRWSTWDAVRAGVPPGPT